MGADLAHYQAQGFIIANQGKMAGGDSGFAYLDANDTLSVLELFER